MTITTKASGQVWGNKKPLLAALVLLAGAAGVYGLVRQSQAARAIFEQQRSKELAEESRAYCSKWGFSPGTEKHQVCVVDLATIRAATEKRLQDDAGIP